MKHLDPVELRGDIERDLADYLDMIATARRMSRMEVAEIAIRQFVDQIKHEASLVDRLTRSKGNEGE